MAPVRSVTARAPARLVRPRLAALFRVHLNLLRRHPAPAPPAALHVPSVGCITLLTASAGRQKSNGHAVARACRVWGFRGPQRVRAPTPPPSRGGPWHRYNSHRYKIVSLDATVYLPWRPAALRHLLGFRGGGATLWLHSPSHPHRLRSGRHTRGVHLRAWLVPRPESARSAARGRPNSRDG